MSRMSENVKTWRRNFKQKIVVAMGGKCQCCGYDKFHDALDLHHINPNEKEFSLGGIRANPQNWNKIVEEIKKCILLCKCCHVELHGGIRKLPEKYDIFDENKLIVFLQSKKRFCEVCNKEIHYVRRKDATTCTSHCYKRLKNKELFRNENILNEIKDTSIEKIAKKYNVFPTTIKNVIKFLSKKRFSKCPTKEELEKLIWDMPTTHIAKKFNVSDKAVEKWCKKYEISKPVRGYWQKLKFLK